MIIAALALPAGCSLDVDYGDTRFQCDGTRDCPDGFTCVAEECRPGGGDGAPTAAFTSDSSFLLVSLDATSSTDPDGDPLDYAWTFGDDSTGTGATISHTYETADTYEVTLTVRDDDGNTDSISNQVSVIAPPEPLAQDDFDRTLDPGWGSADIGGPWTLGGDIDLWRVADGRGRVDVAAGAGPAAFLEDVVTSSADITYRLSPSAVATGSGLYLTCVGRRISAGNTYEITVALQPDGDIRLDLGKRLDGEEIDVDGMTIPGLGYGPGTVLHLRVQVFGTDPTTLRARVWADGEAEPGDWQLAGEDSEPILQASGDLGINSYLSSSATTSISAGFDDLLVVPVE